MSPKQYLARLRKLCGSLPGTGEKDSWGHPNFTAGRKVFAVFEEYQGRPTIVVKATPEEQSALVTDARCYVAPYVGQHGWTGVWLDTGPEWDLIEELVRNAFRQVATRKLLRELDGDGT